MTKVWRNILNALRSCFKWGSKMIFFFLSIIDGFMRASVEVKRPVRKVTISLGERWLNFCLCANLYKKEIEKKSHDPTRFKCKGNVSC